LEISDRTQKRAIRGVCSDRIITGWKLAIMLVAKWKNKRIASRIRVSAPCDGSDSSSGRTPGREIGGKKHNVFFYTFEEA
jgi:hypothetical protein